MLQTPQTSKAGLNGDSQVCLDEIAAFERGGPQPGAQPALHFGGGRGNFPEISFDDVIMLIQPWYNFLTD